ncbi:HAMP domain-containing protein [Desulfatibacillum alkenivorans DSM 16219]|uniref:HAMP domain-containing protein n=1 Tax=Desulfatibacillum alkenivorans DSM 16219 TaxID=1121393 RepID=A0A1M6UCL0_9BACT|nr:methyl-accepting chemotaxis protein [Desulfatibacillum alkenivorans]SHK66903.1 HAMP domain-containing protein [Desulfatibacillum alkenivorans DSM 16219]
MPEKAIMPRRRQYFVKRDFQGAFILKFCLLVLLGAVASTLLIFYFSGDTLTSDFSNSRLVIQSTSRAILPAVIMTNLITLGMVALAVLVLTLVISHKIAGPLFRLEKELEKIGGGNLKTVVTLRNKDQVEALAQSINSMAGQLHTKVSDIRDSLDQMARRMEHEDATGKWAENIEDVKKRIDAHFQL